MSETEAADLVNMLGSEITIPSHYGLFEIHEGDANIFKEEVHKKSSSIKVHILNPDEGVEI